MRDCLAAPGASDIRSGRPLFGRPGVAAAAVLCCLVLPVEARAQAAIEVRAQVLSVEPVASGVGMVRDLALGGPHLLSAARRETRLSVVELGPLGSRPPVRGVVGLVGPAGVLPWVMAPGAPLPAARTVTISFLRN